MSCVSSDWRTIWYSILESDWMSTLIIVSLSEIVDSIDLDEIWVNIDDLSGSIEEWVYQSAKENSGSIGDIILWSGSE